MSEDIPRHKRTIDIVVEKDEWHNLTFDFVYHIKKVSNLVLQEQGAHINSDLELTIMLSDDNKLQELNLHYSNQDKPTNVLAFYYGHDIQGDYLYLGDIAISYQRLENESVEMAKPIQEHLTHLVIHGILHLLGYDHIHDKEAIRMEAIEANLMQKLGYNDPYKGHDEVICS